MTRTFRQDQELAKFYFEQGRQVERMLIIKIIKEWGKCNDGLDILIKQIKEKK